MSDRKAPSPPPVERLGNRPLPPPAPPPKRTGYEPAGDDPYGWKPRALKAEAELATWKDRAEYFQRQRAELFDQLNSSPCEQIRHKEQIDEQAENLNRANADFEAARAVLMAERDKYIGDLRLMTDDREAWRRDYLWIHAERERIAGVLANLIAAAKQAADLLRKTRCAQCGPNSGCAVAGALRILDENAA